MNKHRNIGLQEETCKCKNNKNIRCQVFPSSILTGSKEVFLGLTTVELSTMK